MVRFHDVSPQSLRSATCYIKLLAMKLEINQKIFDQADRCEKGHRCLSGRTEDLCEAEIQLFGDQRFLCKTPEDCAYKAPFGNSYFCLCPVRRAIYDKYGR